jgi:hypothetical protein
LTTLGKKSKFEKKRKHLKGIDQKFKKAKAMMEKLQKTSEKASRKH